MKAIQKEPERLEERICDRDEFILERQAERVIDGDSAGGDCDEVNQEENEQNKVNKVDGTKKGADSTGKVMHI